MRRDEIRDLREQKKRVHGDMIALNSKAEEEKRDLTAEEAQEYDNMEAEFRTLGARIQRNSQLAGMGNELEQEDRQVYLPDGMPSVETLSEYRKAMGKGKAWEAPEYRHAFFHWLTSKSPQTDLDIEEFRVMSKATAGAGGNIVPTVDVRPDHPVDKFPRFSVEPRHRHQRPTSGEALNIPTNPTHGSATWTAENVGFTASDEVFGTAQLSATRLAGRSSCPKNFWRTRRSTSTPSWSAEMGESSAFLRRPPT